MKSELMEKLYTLKEIAQKNTEKINAIRQDRNLSEEGKSAAITPLVDGIKQAAKDTRNKLAYMRGQCIGDVGAAVAARSNMSGVENYAKSAYFFQKTRVLPEDVRGFSQAWSAFKAAADVGDADALRGVIDAMEARWPAYADSYKEIIGQVKDALLPAGDLGIANAKARSKALLELVDFCEGAAENAALHTDEPGIMESILTRALVRLSDFEYKEPVPKERQPLSRVLLGLNIPEHALEPERRNPDAYRDPLQVAAEREAVAAGIEAAS